MDRYNNKDKEIDISEFLKDFVVPTPEEAAESMCEILDYMRRGKDSEYLCYCEGCSNRVEDKPINEYEDLIDESQEFEEEEDIVLEEEIKFKKNENEDGSNDKESSLFENSNDIAASILSDIYGG